jgi:hypothetical protein
MKTKKTKRLLALTTILTCGGWLVYIVWSYLVDNRYWEIDPKDTESMLKFYAALFPSIILAVLHLLPSGPIETSEEIEMDNENRILKKKIEKKELQIKLQNLEASPDVN